MTDHKKEKKNIIDFVTRKAVATPAELPQNILSGNHINGDGFIMAAGDVTINKNQKIIKKNVIKPGPEHITEQQAYKIQQLIYKLAERDAATGFANGEVGKARQKWWSILRKHYQVSSYKLLPVYLFEDVIKYLQQHKAMTRSKLRNSTTKSTWRNEHYSAIFARSGNLNISKGELYAMLSQRLDLRVISLRKVSDQNLKKAYNIVMAL